MKKGKSEIVQTLRGNSKYFVSIVEKENDSGIFFNQRIFFLLATQHIGYLSQIKITQEPEKINFQKPKTTVLLTNLKSIVMNEKQLSIKFYLIDGNKKSQRIWILRMESEDLAKKWYDLLQKEKVSLTSKVSTLRKSQDQEVKSPLPKRELSEKKNFEIVKNIELAETGQKQKEVREFKEIGIGMSPKHAENNNKGNQSSIIYSHSKQLSPEEKLNSIMKQNENKKQNTPSKVNNSSQQPFFPSRKQATPRREQPLKVEPNRPSSPKKEPIKKEQSILQPQKQETKSQSQQYQRQSQQPQKQQMQNQPATSQVTKMQKTKPQNQQRQQPQPQEPQPPKQPALQASKISQAKSPRSELNSSSSLVNTRYLKRQANKQRQEQHAYGQNSRNRDYLERTHQLVRSFEQEQSNRSQPKISVFRERQNNSNNITEERQINQSDKSNWNELPWTYRYVKYGHLVFKQFQLFTQQLIHEIIVDLSKQGKRFKPKLIKNNIYYFDIKDVEVKLALIGLQEIEASSQTMQTERVCNKQSIKRLQNQFNNLKALYQYCENGRLKVALSTLCEYNGFVGLFKVTSKHMKKTIRIKQVEPQLLALQKNSKIQVNFMQELDNIIIQLDDGYYDSFKKTQEDKKINFNLYLIQEIQSFLLPDLMSEQPLLLLRKELIDNYRTNPTPIQKYKFFSKNSQQVYTQQLQNFSKNIPIAISEVIMEMDSFRAYFLNSKDFSCYLHAKGINIRYLGHLYQNLKTVFQRRFVMTEIAARSCKALFRKTIQDVMLGEQSMQKQEFHSKICDFLNCVLGSTYETAAIWKVLSTHAKSYFGFQLNFDQIDRGHFVISLIQQCKLNVLWQRISPQEAFKSNIYFTQNNLIGLNCTNKSYSPYHSQDYRAVGKILQGEEVYSGFQELVDVLQLKDKTISKDLSVVQNEIRRYLSFFISPFKAQDQYPHLKLFETSDKSCPSRHKFDLLLMQIKWFLKLRDRDQYIKICDYFIRLATKYYGEFHPIFSQLYELFSAYHLTNSEYQDAITFAKSSLVNILKICGTNHEKTSQCYYHLALCYIKCSKSDEAVTHVKKALSILDNNNKTQSIAFAVMQLKLGLLYLNLNQIELCIRCTRNSLAIFEAKAGEVQGSFQDEIVECLQILNRSYELLGLGSQGREVLQQCQLKLLKTRKPDNLQKLLKIYLYPVLSGLSPQKASNYLDIISLMTIEPNQENYESAYKLLRQRIKEQSLLPNLFVYLNRLQEIESRMRQTRILDEWSNFSEVYQRQTLKDFMSLSLELVTFLGEGYMCGSLREAL